MQKNIRNILFFLFVCVVFSFAHAERLYWVNGTGNFNDATHWALQSGGKGGVKVPGANDDVVIDRFSFRNTVSTITISGEVNVHDFEVKECFHFVLQGSEYATLSINGSLLSLPHLENKFFGKIVFTSKQKEEVFFSTSEVKGDVVFRGKGEFNIYTLVASDNSTVSFENGIYNLNSSSIFTGNLIANQNKVTLNLKKAVLSTSNKFILGNNVVLNDFESYIQAPIEDKDKYQISESIHFSSTAKFTSNNTVFNCMSSFTFTVTPPTCAGACDGIVKFTVPAVCSGTAGPPYIMNWQSNPPPGQPACPVPNSDTNVVAGVHTVTGVCGCASVYTVIIGDQFGGFAAIKNPSVTDPGVINPFFFPSSPSCYLSCDGRIDVFIVGGVPPYDVYWTPSGGVQVPHNGIMSDDSLTNICLPASTYSQNFTVEIVDANTCPFTYTTTLTQPQDLLANGVPTNASCFGYCDAKIKVVPSGGNPPYTYVWDAIPANNKDSLTGLCAPSTHSVVIKDTKNCTVTYTASVTQPTDFTYTKSSGDTLSCYNGNDGNASVTGVSGATPLTTGGYTYTWLGPNSPTVSNTPVGAPVNSFASLMTSGTYSVIIADKNGCDDTTTFTIINPPELIASVTTTSVSCNGGSNGTASVTSVGGRGTVSFKWLDPTAVPTLIGTGPNIGSLSANITYSLVATDSKGCDDTVTFSVIEPAPLVITATPSNPGCFGSLLGQVCGAWASGGSGSISSFSFSPVIAGGTVVGNCYTNIPTGNYTITGTDANGCPTSATATLTSPTKIISNLTYSDPTCNALCNGTAIASPTGGNGWPYTYTWSCSTDVDSIIGGQCAGNCMLIVKDKLGCPDTTTFTYIEPSALSLSMAHTNVNCYGASTAFASATVSGGTLPYTYMWDNNPIPNSPSIPNLPAGTHVLLVTDSNSCTIKDSVLITQPPAIVITETHTNPTCNNFCDGSITASASGGTPPYVVQSWNPALPPSFNQSNLCSGSYILTVRDAFGCRQKDTIVLVNPTTISVNIDTTIVSCAGGNNGTATATVTGGTPAYTYFWSANTGSQTTLTAVGLSAGTYFVDVYDANSCPASAIAIVTEPTLLTALVNTITPSCSNICNGSANITVSGGTPGYSYVLDGTPGVSPPFSGLCAGLHTVTVSDAKGCTKTTTFVVPLLLSTVISPMSTSLVCSGDCNATASVNVIGSTGILDYLWTPTAQTTQTAINLCAGTYVVEVTDAGSGCIVTDTVVITNPPVFTVNVSTTPASCKGTCNGVSTASVAGGLAPYTYVWSDGATTAVNNGLCAGTYTVTATDANGCSRQQTIAVTEPGTFTVTSGTIQPSTCGGSDGAVSVNVTGSNGSIPSDYSYTWDPPLVGTGGNTATYSDLPSGGYSVTIIDSKGCDTVIVSALSDPNGPVSIGDSSNISCPGFCDGVITITVTNSSGPALIAFPGFPGTNPSPFTANGLCKGSYVITITDTTACASFQAITITDPPPFIFGPVITNVSCFGGSDGSISLTPSGGTLPYTYTLNGNPTSNPMTSLTAGVYTVVVRDSNNCAYTFIDTVKQPAPITATEVHTPISCATGLGTATITANGGTLPYSYSWTPAGVPALPSVSLATGAYTCTVKDVKNCSTTVSLTIIQNPPLVSGFTYTNNLCNTSCTGTATFNASGGSGTYTYAWSSPAGSTASSQTGLCIGSYSATVSDNNGCSITENFTVTAPPLLTMSVASSDPLCFGGASGSITVNANGGTPAYSYDFGSGTVPSATANGLPAATYTVKVIDSKGCNTQQVVTLSTPTKLQSGIVATPPACFGACNGVLHAYPSGGTPSYVYTWGPPAAVGVDSITGLCSGTYYGIVTDANGCRDSLSFTFSNPAQLTLTYTTTLATCGLVPCDGSLTITSTTGDSLYWINSTPPGYTGLSQNSLCSGVYDIIVSDLSGCSDTVHAAVSDANGPVVNVDSVNTTCRGVCDGQVFIASVSGLNPPFTYSWNLPIPATNTTTIATNLCTGTYVSIVKDVFLCKTVTPITVGQPSVVNDNETIVLPSCASVSNGSITLAPSGGTPYTVGAPYHYQWSANANTGDTPTATTLGPGTYSVIVIDSNLCQTSFTYVLGTGTPIFHQITATPATCFGQNSGVASVNNLSGGLPPYSLSWSDGQSGTVANMLYAGTYSVTITDNAGCVVIDSVKVTEPVKLSVNANVTGTPCGICSGSIALAPTGGTGTYTYLWGNGQTAATATNLCAGIHMVDIKDAVGCVTQYSLAVNNTAGPTYTLNSTNVNCAGQCTGTASVSVITGTAPYQYNWIGVAGAPISPSVTNLCAGTYFVQVKDADNCIINDTVVISENTTLTLSTTASPTACGVCAGSATAIASGGTAPYVYSWGSATQTNMCAGSYSVIVTDAVGCKDTAYANINSVNGPRISIVSDSTLCNGGSDGSATVTINGGTAPYTANWDNNFSVVIPTATGFDAGIHTLTITDASGCSSSKIFEVYEPEGLSLSLSNTQLATCQAACNGAITAIPSGGTVPYTYLWSPGALTTSSIANQCAGLYGLVVTDNHGCVASQNIQLLNNPNPFNVVENTVSANCGFCDGSSALTLSGGQAPYSYAWSNDSTNTSSSASNLCAGIYMVNIFDNLGCSQQYNLSINNSSGPQVTVATTDVSCVGQCTGSAVANANGGLTPYQYNWVGMSSSSSGSSINNLCVGTNYFVQVKDANNCVTNTPFAINSVAVLYANSIVTSNNCGVCNGAISLNPTGGVAPYTYSWSNSGTGSSQSNLCAGNYWVILSDAGGCSDTVRVALSSTNAPIVNINVDSVLCYGAADGAAILTISGGTPGYTIAWSNGASTNPVAGLSAGMYSYSVTDAAGCVFAQVFEVEQPTPLSLSLNNTQLPNCLAFCNGSLTAIPSGGTLNYQYSWSVPGITTDTLTNLCPNTYNLTVTDGNGCTKTQTTVLIPNPIPFSIDTAFTLPGCNLCNGAIDLTMLSGVPPYSFAWSTGPADTLEDVMNVCAGALSVSIIDSAGCSQTISFTINNANGITGDSLQLVNETCMGTCDGTASVFPIGGTPGYSYLWTPSGDTTSTVANLCAGPYSVTVTDSNNCKRIIPVTILSPNQMTATTTVVRSNCAVNDGSITINVNGGASPLSYLWNPISAAGDTNVANNLGAGQYIIQVTDNTPCVQSFTVNLSDVGGPQVTVYDTAVSCYGLCDGSITLGVVSVNPPVVTWSNTVLTDTFNLNLCPGNYTAIVVDPILACSTLVSATIIEPDSLGIGTYTAVDMSCFGLCNGKVNLSPFGGTLPYTYSWLPGTGNGSTLDSLCAGTYTGTVIDNNGCTVSQSATVAEPTLLVASGVVTPASCSSVPNGAIDITVTGGNPGYVYQWSVGSVATTQDITNIFFGNYTLVVTDTTACTTTVNFNVSTTDTVLANAGIDTVFCYSSTFTLNGLNSFVNTTNVTYQWTELTSGNTVGTTLTAPITPAAGISSYQLIITNAVGCADTDTVVITANPLPVADAGPDVAIMLDNTSAIGGNPTGPVNTSVIWTPDVFLSEDSIANPVSSATVTTTYVVMVIDTATGCMAKDSMVLTIIPPMVIPDGISPNGDGKNDTWIINYISEYPDNEVEIYNRWGELLYSKKQYDNSWDGTYKGKLLPVGTYYYVVKLNHERYPDALTGPITIFK